MKQYWKIGAVAALLIVLGGAAAGIIAAQEPTGTPDATSTAEDEATATDEATTPGDSSTDESSEDKDALRGQFLERLAANLGVSVEDLTAALQQTGLDLVDQAVADGRITEEEASAIRERIQSGEFPFFPFGLRHHRGGPGCGLLGVDAEELSEFLGITPAELREAKMNGQSLAQIAEANGVSVEDLSAFLLAEITEYVNQAVENERITQERADEILANAPERIDNLINRTGPGVDGMEDGGVVFPGGPVRSRLSGELF